MDHAAAGVESPQLEVVHDGGADDVPTETLAPVALPSSLSPSRASDFMTCPLLFRFRTIDRLPQKPSSVAVRGTLVHAALERLFDLPAGQRTPEAAVESLRPRWAELVAQEPGIEVAVADIDIDEWFESAAALVHRYFGLEDPNRLEPADREILVQTTLDDGLVLRGYIDRLDIAPTGEVRVVDYKTGKSPGEAFEGKALFQMRFYALVLWRDSGSIPTMLQLLYLGNSEVLRDRPDEASLIATERKVKALWAAIVASAERREFKPRKSALCSWCDHQALCPEFGGTPPPLPVITIGPPADPSPTDSPVLSPEEQM